MASTSTTSIGSKRSYESTDDCWLSWSDVFETAGVVVEDVSKIPITLGGFVRSVDKSEWKPFLDFALRRANMELQDADLDAILEQWS